MITEGTTPEPETPHEIAGALESLEISVDASASSLRMIADHLGSIRDSLARISEALAILVAKGNP